MAPRVASYYHHPLECKGQANRIHRCDSVSRCCWTIPFDLTGRREARGRRAHWVQMSSAWPIMVVDFERNPEGWLTRQIFWRQQYQTGCHIPPTWCHQGRNCLILLFF